jgi:hypothetical protein
MAAELYGRLSGIQPGQTEVRIISGEPDRTTVRNALPDAMRYMDRQCRSGALRTAALLKHTVAQSKPLEHPPVGGR